MATACRENENHRHGDSHNAVFPLWEPLIEGVFLAKKRLHRRQARSLSAGWRKEDKSRVQRHLSMLDVKFEGWKHRDDDPEGKVDVRKTRNQQHHRPYHRIGRHSNHTC